VTDEVQVNWNHCPSGEVLFMIQDHEHVGAVIPSFSFAGPYSPPPPFEAVADAPGAILSQLAETLEVQPLLQSSPSTLFPSSHSSEPSTTPFPQQGLMAEFTQPEPGSQLSVVQALLSSQGRLPVPLQLPPEHTSPVVHALPSSQPELLLA